MDFAVVGVDQTTCPVSVREPMAVSGQAAVALLKQIRTQATVDEAVVVSTCARTEIYLYSQADLPKAVECSRAALVDLNPRATGYIVTRTDEAAVFHAFRVTSGLESQILGEEEVTGQVRSAVAAAREHGAIGPNLSALFEAAIACSRRLRRESKLGDADANAGSATAAMARELRSIEESNVLIIGSGTIAKMLATEFRGARSVALASRTPANISLHSNRLGVEVIHLEEGLSRVGEFDIICCATRTHKPILTRERMKDVTKSLIFDLSVPRAVDQRVMDLPGITLVDIDSVRPVTTVERNQDTLRQGIVNAEVHDFVSKRALSEIGPIIAALRAHVDRVREEEVARIRPNLERLARPDRDAVETVIQRMIDRMFHHLVVRLRLSALTDADLVRAAEFFFAHGEDSLFPNERAESDADRKEAVETSR